MKTPLLIAAACLLLAIVAGMVPCETTINAAEETHAVDTYVPEAPAEEPAAEPEVAEPTPAASCPNCPTAKRSGGSHCASSGRDWVLFDGDGYFIDRRAEVAASNAGRWYPGKLLFKGARKTAKAVIGVERRQNRRAAGRGLFRRRC